MSGQRTDDARDLAGAPRGAPRPGRDDTPDVVVVGAGVSGLVCARALHDAGLDVVVLEAAPRLGGRVRTLRRAGREPVELGAQWVADGHHRLRALLDDHGLGLHRPPRRGRVVHVDARGRRVLPARRASAGGLGPVATADLAIASLRLSLRARGLPAPSDASAASDWLDRACTTAGARELLAGQLEAAACLPAADVSLRWVLEQVRTCDGLAGLADTEQQTVVGGLGALVDSLAAPLDVRTDQPARELVRRGERWRVLTPAAVVEADHVVLATPPVPTDRLLSPGAGPERRPGAVVKVVASYDRPFWREAGHSGLATDVSARAVVTGTVDAGGEDPRSPGRLVGFVTGRAAQRLATLAPREQRAAVLASLVDLHGPAAGHPVDLHVHDWSQEAWTPGGYTWPSPPGAAPGHVGTVSGVHLAGSENARRWPGFVEGAVDAGQVTADAVLAAAPRPRPRHTSAPRSEETP